MFWIKENLLNFKTHPWHWFEAFVMQYFVVGCDYCCCNHLAAHRIICCQLSHIPARAQSYYWDMMLSKEFKPIGVQFSLKAVLPLAERLATGDSITVVRQGPGGWFNIKMSSYQYRKSHCGDKTILRPSYLHNGISYTGKMTSLYWIRALDSIATWSVSDT